MNRRQATPADDDVLLRKELASLLERAEFFVELGHDGVERFLYAYRTFGPHRLFWRQSQAALAANQGDIALHCSIDVEDSGQPEAEMAAGRNAAGRRRANARVDEAFA